MKIIESPSSNVNNNQNVSLWKKGKLQHKEFGNYHVKKSTFIWTTLAGIVLTLLAVLPFILFIIQIFKTFYYNPQIKVFLVVIAWVTLLVMNGLSNYYTVVLTKNNSIDDEKLQAFDEKAIFFYNVFNIKFIIFTLVIMIGLVLGII